MELSTKNKKTITLKSNRSIMNIGLWRYLRFFNYFDIREKNIQENIRVFFQYYGGGRRVYYYYSYFFFLRLAVEKFNNPALAVPRIERKHKGKIHACASPER